MATNDEVIAKIDELLEARKADQDTATQHPVAGLVLGMWDYLAARVGPMAAAVVIALVGFHYTVHSVLDRPEIKAKIEANTAADEAAKAYADAKRAAIASPP